jgi:chromosome segregation ATPase
MTTNQPDKLDRLEALLERFINASAADRQASGERLTRIEQLVESNSRSIQALNDDLAELRLVVAEDHEQARQEREELRRATIGIANLLGSLDEDRPTILKKLNTIENKVDRLLERGNGDQPQP